MRERVTAFAAELKRVDWIEQYLTEACALRVPPREMAAAIEEELSRPDAMGPLRENIRGALTTTCWPMGAREQSLRSILRHMATDGYLGRPADAIISTLVEAVLTECRIPTVEMVDAGQAEINSGAQNFMRIWLKAFEKA